jgi:metacaspase-1
MPESFPPADSVSGAWAIAAPPKAINAAHLPTRAIKHTPIVPCRPPPCKSHSKFTGRNTVLAPNLVGIAPTAPFRAGKRRALLVGINYSRTRGIRQLTGCVNDTKILYGLLATSFNFDDEDMWVMTDEPVDLPINVRTFPPTRNNILNGMRWLVRGGASGDALFFAYSGHGGQVRDTNGDELDGWDETILPMDYPTAGHIIDDEIHDIMVLGLPQGAYLTALFDACNSGTIMDLPFVHSTLGGALGAALGIPEEKIRASAALAGDNKTGLAALFRPRRSRRHRHDAELVRHADLLQQRQAELIRDKGHVISFSSCADHQRSADAFSRSLGSGNGAMTHAFVEAVRDAMYTKTNISIDTLLKIMSEMLTRQGHTQMPQVSTSHDISLSTQFTL